MNIYTNKNQENEFYQTRYNSKQQDIPDIKVTPKDNKMITSTVIINRAYLTKI